MVRASSGPSATNRNARASTTLCSPLAGSRSRRNAAPIRARCSSGSGNVCAIRTVGSGRSGQFGSASRNCTDCGRISAAGLDMSNGKAPRMIGALCDASAARASASSWNAVCTPSATTALPPVASTKVGSRVTRAGTGGG